LSVRELLIQLRKFKLGRTKPSTGPHAGRGLDIAVLVSVKDLSDATAVL